MVPATLVDWSLLSARSHLGRAFLFAEGLEALALTASLRL
jgi:hypothetical protein